MNKFKIFKTKKFCNFKNKLNSTHVLIFKIGWVFNITEENFNLFWSFMSLLTCSKTFLFPETAKPSGNYFGSASIAIWWVFQM